MTYKSAAEVIAEALIRDSFGLIPASEVERQATAVIGALWSAGYTIEGPK